MESPFRGVSYTAEFLKILLVQPCGVRYTTELPFRGVSYTPESPFRGVSYTAEPTFCQISLEYSEKIEILTAYLWWEQEELFDEKTNTKKSRDTVPLNSLHAWNHCAA